LLRLRPEAGLLPSHLGRRSAARFKARNQQRIMQTPPLLDGQLHAVMHISSGPQSAREEHSFDEQVSALEHQQPPSMRDQHKHGKGGPGPQGEGALQLGGPVWKQSWLVHPCGSQGADPWAHAGLLMLVRTGAVHVIAAPAPIRLSILRREIPDRETSPPSLPIGTPLAARLAMPRRAKMTVHHHRSRTVPSSRHLMAVFHIRLEAADLAYPRRPLRSAA